MALNARAAWRAPTVSSASLIALLATSTFLTPTLALAQQQPTTVLEDIVVTAQRQAESLQDVPIAVAAFGAADLEKRQIESFGDLQFSAPNVNFTVGNFTTSNTPSAALATPSSAAARKAVSASTSTTCRC
ncbi:hypothetical protein [Parapedomonas caeni]